MTSLNDIEAVTPEKRSTEAVKLTTLGSGVRVVTETMEHVATAACGIWVGAGARHEHAEEHGLAHLLEHMAFKGTKKRSAREIVETIEHAHVNCSARATRQSPSTVTNRAGYANCAAS